MYSLLSMRGAGYSALMTIEHGTPNAERFEQQSQTNGTLHAMQQRTHDIQCEIMWYERKRELQEQATARYRSRRPVPPELVNLRRLREFNRQKESKDPPSPYLMRKMFGLLSKK